MSGSAAKHGLGNMLTLFTGFAAGFVVSLGTVLHCTPAAYGPL